MIAARHPTEVKLGLGVIICWCCFPGGGGAHSPSPVYVVGVLMQELFVGYTLALHRRPGVRRRQRRRQLMDNLSGTNMAQVMVPALQQSVSSTLRQGAAVRDRLSHLDGHHLVIASLATASTACRSTASPSSHHGMWAFFHLVIRGSGRSVPGGDRRLRAGAAGRLLTDFLAA